MSGRQRTGEAWEKAAGAYLEQRGVEVLLRRYRCRLGELDLVCADGETLVVVEVRARGGGALSPAVETVDWSKQRRILQATRHLLMRHPSWSERPLRFDVIAIDAIDQQTPRLTWVRNAFEAA